MVWYDIVLKLQYACFIVVLKRHGIGQVHRRRSAQRMRSETSNTAIDLCPGAAFNNDTHPVTSFTKVLHRSATSTQAAVNAPRSECSAPWTGIWSAAACFRCKY